LQVVAAPPFVVICLTKMQVKKDIEQGRKRQFATKFATGLHLVRLPEQIVKKSKASEYLIALARWGGGVIT
jgi:hypothetical protein